MGAVLAGKYRVDRVLGQGGMGVVVQAMHLQLDQPVAMKFLLPEVLTNPQVVQRFLREAQAVVRLKSEHVARVIDVGTLENGAPYMVIEYLDGADLSGFPRQQLTIGQHRRPHAAGVRGARRGARARDRSPRHQAREPLPHAAPPTARACSRCSTSGSRRLQHDGARGQPDRDVDGDGHAGVHVARADAVDARRRSPDRHLVARRRALRAAPGRAAVRRRDVRGDGDQGRDRAVASARRAAAARSRRDRVSLPREGPGAPVPERRRARARARAVRAVDRPGRGVGRAHEPRARHRSVASPSTLSSSAGAITRPPRSPGRRLPFIIGGGRGARGDRRHRDRGVERRRRGRRSGPVDEPGRIAARPARRIASPPPHPTRPWRRPRSRRSTPRSWPCRPTLPGGRGAGAVPKKPPRAAQVAQAAGRAEAAVARQRLRRHPR